MNMKNLLVVVSAVALATSAAAQTHVSLPELAKAEKARRAKIEKSGGAAKVYTEADRSGGDTSQPTADAPSGGATAVAASAAGKGKKEKTPEEVAAERQKEWSDKVKQAQDQINSLQAGIATKERNLASLVNITPARVDLANSIEADKKKLADLQQSLVSLEDERRKAGIPRPR